MSLQLLFWMVYILALVFGGWLNYAPNTPWLKPFGSYFAIWLLVGILGWKVFGPAIHS